MAVMKQLRESTKVIMILTSIAFVGLMVFQWGMDLSGRSSRQGSGTQLGSVNGAEISIEEYQRQYQILYDQADKGAPEGLSPQEVDRIEQQAWDDVVNLTLLRDEARKRGIDLNDAELVEYIRNNPPAELVSLPAFQTNGQFDLQKYQQALADPALEQTWIQYEEQLRRTLPIQKLQEQIVAGITVTDAELLQAYKARNERARIAYLYLDPQKLVADSAATVGEDEVRAYYEAHRDDYRREESAQARWVSFAPAVTAADTAAARAEADSLARLARQPDEKFVELARQASDDRVTADNGGDLGWVRLATLAPSLADAVRRLEPGQVSDPVLSPFGWHVVRLEQRQTQDGDVLYHVSHILKEIGPSPAERQQARQRAQEFARAASRSGDEAFDDAAHAGGVEVHATPVFEKGVVIPGIGAAPGLSDFVFGNDAGSVSGPLERDGAFYVLRIDRRFPAGTIALDQVAGDIRAELTRKKRLDATRKMAPRVTDMIRRGGLEEAARRLGLEIHTTDWFTRTNDIPGVGSGTAVAGAAFGLAQGQTAGPVETDRGLYFLRLLEKQPYDPAAFENGKAELRDQLRLQKMRQAFNAWFEALRDKAQVRDNRARLLGGAAAT